MLQAKIDGEWVELPEGTKASCALGDRQPIHDTCGCMGLCKKCNASGATEGCGKYYVAFYIVGKADNDQWLVTLPDGTELWADDFQVIDIVMGERTDGRVVF